MSRYSEAKTSNGPPPHQFLFLPLDKQTHFTHLVVFSAPLHFNAIFFSRLGATLTTILALVELEALRLHELVLEVGLPGDTSLVHGHAFGVLGAGEGDDVVEEGVGDQTAGTQIEGPVVGEES